MVKDENTVEEADTKRHLRGSLGRRSHWGEGRAAYQSQALDPHEATPGLAEAEEHQGPQVPAPHFMWAALHRAFPQPTLALPSGLAFFVILTLSLKDTLQLLEPPLGLRPGAGLRAQTRAWHTAGPIPSEQTALEATGHRSSRP